MSKVVLLTGGSKGIGYAAAASFARKGCRIYEISRHEVKNPGVVHIAGDVTDPASVAAAVRSVVEREGRIDVLVCNAGTVISGAVEFTPVEEAKKLMDLNFFGMDNAVRAVIPVMRKNGGGKIVCLSSLAGVWPIPFQIYYSASKAVIRAYTFALHNELSAFNIGVCAIMPGDTNSQPVRTKFHGGSEYYGKSIDRSVAVMEKDENNGMSVDVVGEFVSRVALKRRTRPYYCLGFAYNAALVANRILPSSFVRWVLRLAYVKKPD